MGFVDAIKSFYRRYADFQGRSSRSEYWWVALYQIILVVPLVLPMVWIDESSLGKPNGAAGLIAILLAVVLLLYVLVHIIPNIALAVRRFHDINMSGWWYLGFILIGMIPLVGVIASIVQIVFFVRRGTMGPNRYGDDPLMPVEEVFS